MPMPIDGGHVGDEVRRILGAVAPRSPGELLVVDAELEDEAATRAGLGSRGPFQSAA